MAQNIRLKPTELWLQISAGHGLAEGTWAVMKILEHMQLEEFSSLMLLSRYTFDRTGISCRLRFCAPANHLSNSKMSESIGYGK